MTEGNNISWSDVGGNGGCNDMLVTPFFSLTGVNVNER